MVSEDEIAGYIKNLGFKSIERGAAIAGGNRGFCYVLGQKS